MKGERKVRNEAIRIRIEAVPRVVSNNTCLKIRVLLKWECIKTKPAYPISAVGAGVACPKTQSKLFSDKQTSSLQTKRQHYPRFDTLPKKISKGNYPAIQLTSLTATNLQSFVRQCHINKTSTTVRRILSQYCSDFNSSFGVFGYHIKITSSTCSRQLIT